MKLVSLNEDGSVAVELDVKKYAMPVKGVAGSVNINGESVPTMFTSGRGKEYTYFRIKNVDLYVAGALDADTAYTVDLPEGFGSEEAPSVRKSYYVRKRPALAADGGIPVGGGADAGADEGAAKTDLDTGNKIEATAPADAPFEQSADTDPEGQTIDVEASQVAAKSRSKRK